MTHERPVCSVCDDSEIDWDDPKNPCDCPCHDGLDGRPPIPQSVPSWDSPPIGIAKVTERPEGLLLLWRVMEGNRKAEERRRLNYKGALVTTPFFLAACLAVLAYVSQMTP